jgi:putative hydrolase of HD superfamily
MQSQDIESLLAFLRAAEKLKATHRSGYTSAGNPESVAEHTWRLCLMAMLIGPEIGGVDVGRVVRICIVHDLGEAISGDVPAPEQVRRIALGEPAKHSDERQDVIALAALLPDRQRDEVIALWDEYEEAITPEARLAKGLDKLETILQHTQGLNPPDFDLRFNLGYGRDYTNRSPLIAAVRAILDQDTARLAEQSDAGVHPPR